MQLFLLFVPFIFLGEKVSSDESTMHMLQSVLTYCQCEYSKRFWSLSEIQYTHSSWGDQITQKFLPNMPVCYLSDVQKKMLYNGNVKLIYLELRQETLSANIS